jgi:hypothetical protein
MRQSPQDLLVVTRRGGARSATARVALVVALVVTLLGVSGGRAGATIADPPTASCTASSAIAWNNSIAYVLPAGALGYLPFGPGCVTNQVDCGEGPVCAASIAMTNKATLGRASGRIVVQGLIKPYNEWVTIAETGPLSARCSKGNTATVLQSCNAFNVAPQSLLPGGTEGWSFTAYRAFCSWPLQVNEVVLAASTSCAIALKAASPPGG